MWNASGMESFFGSLLPIGRYVSAHLLVIQQAVRRIHPVEAFIQDKMQLW